VGAAAATVDKFTTQSLLEVTIPVVFNGVVCSTWEVLGYGRPSIS
jgi:hypothetical protein